MLEAAALLDITEFRFFRIAYQRWFGRRSNPLMMERYFANYMFNAVVPPWVRHLAREILQKAQTGTLSLAEYGIRQRPATPAVQRRGRIFGALLLAWCLLLFLAALYYSDLLPFTQNCYFPPCY